MSDRSSAVLGGFWILSVLSIIVIFAAETADSTGRVVLTLLGFFYVVGSVLCWLSRFGKD